MHQPKRQGLVKVVFRLESDAWHGSATETLWGTLLSDGRVRLENSPFFAFGVSFRDIVAVEEANGELVFDRVVIFGGHSTYRIIKTSNEEALFERYWKALRDIGCTYEEGRVLAVDLPPDTDVYAAYDALQAGEDAGAWGFEEGHCGHPLEGRRASTS
ncbi:MAG: DUF4265 domain-containing protein [Myxococcota bacterium]